MEKVIEIFEDLRSDLTSRNKGVAFHSAAVDMRILALTSLLMEKGILTEEEVQKSYKKVVDVFLKNEEFKDERFKGLEEYIKDYLRI